MLFRMFFSFVFQKGQSMTDWEYLYLDLFELTILALALAQASPYHRLTSANTPSSLKSFPAFLSLGGHVALILAAQILAFILVQPLACDSSVVPGLGASGGSSGNRTSGYDGPLKWMAEIRPTGCERWACFTVGALQIVFLSFNYSTGPPFSEASL